MAEERQPGRRERVAVPTGDSVAQQQNFRFRPLPQDSCLRRNDRPCISLPSRRATRRPEGIPIVSMGRSLRSGPRDLGIYFDSEPGGACLLAIGEFAELRRDSCGSLFQDIRRDCAGGRPGVQERWPRLRRRRWRRQKSYWRWPE